MRIRVKKKKKDSKFVAKAIILDNDRILLLKRSDYLKKHKGEWDLPGGHIHIGEDLTEGLVREVKEETNLSIVNPKEVFKHKNDTFFLVKMKTTNIRLSNEHVSYKFFNIEDLDDLDDLTTYYRESILRCIEVKTNNE